MPEFFDIHLGKRRPLLLHGRVRCCHSGQLITRPSSMQPSQLMSQAQRVTFCCTISNTVFRYPHKLHRHPAANPGAHMNDLAARFLTPWRMPLIRSPKPKHCSGGCRPACQQSHADDLNAICHSHYRPGPSGGRRTPRPPAPSTRSAQHLRLAIGAPPRMNQTGGRFSDIQRA